MYLLFAGFRCTHHPPAPSHGKGDNVPDIHDEFDFDTQGVLERFISNMSMLADDEYQSLAEFLVGICQ